MRDSSNDMAATASYRGFYLGPTVLICLLSLATTYATALFYFWSVMERVDIRPLVMMATIVVGGVAVLMAVQASVKAHQISRAHLELKRAFLKVQEGDMSVRLSESECVTPEELAPAFNRMMGFLEQRT